eukprot:gene21602-biopygen17665
MCSPPMATPWEKRQWTWTGREPDGRTIEFKETDADRTRTGRIKRRFSPRPFVGTLGETVVVSGIPGKWQEMHFGLSEQWASTRNSRCEAPARPSPSQSPRTAASPPPGPAVKSADPPKKSINWAVGKMSRLRDEGNAPYTFEKKTRRKRHGEKGTAGNDSKENRAKWSKQPRRSVRPTLFKLFGHAHSGRANDTGGRGEQSSFPTTVSRHHFLHPQRVVAGNVEIIWFYSQNSYGGLRPLPVAHFQAVAWIVDSRPLIHYSVVTPNTIIVPNKILIHRTKHTHIFTAGPCPAAVAPGTFGAGTPPPDPPPPPGDPGNRRNHRNPGSPIFARAGRSVIMAGRAWSSTWKDRDQIFPNSC